MKIGLLARLLTASVLMGAVLPATAAIKIKTGSPKTALRSIVGFGNSSAPVGSGENSSTI